MVSWKALRFARVASLKPCAAAAAGDISVPSRAVSVRSAVKAAAPLTSSSNSGLSSAETSGAHCFRSVSISLRVEVIPSAYFFASFVSVAA
jgi:hypothetical protein